MPRRNLLTPAELAQQTDRGIVLADALVELLRLQRIILPTVDVIERVCSEALSDFHRRALDGPLSIHEGTKGSGLIWPRQPPGPPKPKHLLAHLKRLKTIRDLALQPAQQPAVVLAV